MTGSATKLLTQQLLQPAQSSNTPGHFGNSGYGYGSTSLTSKCGSVVGTLQIRIIQVRHGSFKLILEEAFCLK